MLNLEKRIAALKAIGSPPCRWVWRNVGESEAAAQARAGTVASDNVIIFSWKEHYANTFTPNIRAGAGQLLKH